MLVPFPHSIQVGGLEYQVVIDPKLLEKEGIVGLCSHNELKISLFPLLRGLMNINFWHESIYCIDKVFFHNKLDETETNALANGIYQVLKGMGIEIDWEE